jgi:hypothetical protein
LSSTRHLSTAEQERATKQDARSPPTGFPLGSRSLCRYQRGRQANQGVFPIFPEDQGSETSELGGGNFGGDGSIMKTIRVVTTVQYYLDK